jgi:DNA-binding transcriptional ArsR family regulator
MWVAGTDQLSAGYSALAEPNSRAVLEQLGERDATVMELCSPLPTSMPAVSHHLKVLERAALLSRTRSGKRRASHLETAPLREAAGWIDRIRRFRDSSLDRLHPHPAAVLAAARRDKEEPLMDVEPPRLALSSAFEKLDASLPHLRAIAADIEA